MFLGGAGATRCEKWSESRNAEARLSRAPTKDNASGAALSFGLKSWVLGYITGLSSGTDSGAAAIEQTILCETNESDVLRRIDGFCRANPDALLVQAAALVSADIMRAKASRIERALENAMRGLNVDVSCR